jgi:hypothetical protein
MQQSVRSITMSNNDFFLFFLPFFQEKVMQHTICSLDNNEWRRFMISHVAVTEFAPDSVVCKCVCVWVCGCVVVCVWLCVCVCVCVCVLLDR